MFPMWDAESCEGHEPRAIAFERHESGILRDKSFDSIGDKMTVRVFGKHFKNLFFSGMAASVGTLFKPEENINGILLYDLRTWSNNVVSVGVKAPTDILSRDLPIISQGETGFQPILIPAGLGVYMQLTQTYNIPAFIRWDFLNPDGSVA